MRWIGIAGFIVAAARAQTTLPDPATLIHKALAAQAAQEKRGAKYTFREDDTRSHFDKNGKESPPETKTYEHIMLEGASYKKLILIEGKPPDAKTQRKIDEDLEKARAERVKHRSLNHRSVTLGGLDRLEKLFDNKVVGEETVRGRAAWRMESEPRPGYKPANSQEEQTMAARQVNWFDREDGTVIKWRSEFIRAERSFQPGSTLEYERIKVGEDWLQESFAMHADVKFAPGIRIRAADRQRYYNYRRFTVDSAIVPDTVP